MTKDSQSFPTRERAPLEMFDTVFRNTPETKYVVEPTVRLFTSPSVVSPSGRPVTVGYGMLPNDETMIVNSVKLDLLGVKSTQACRDILDGVTLGLMINTAYVAWLSSPERPSTFRRFYIDPGEGGYGGQVAARMGFYVTALISRRAKAALEANEGAHLLVRLEGTHIRDLV